MSCSARRRAWLKGGRGYPAAVRTDDGPEFTGRAFIARTPEHRVRHLLIEPDEPMHSGYIGRFNGKFRDECQHEHVFQIVKPERKTIA